MPETVSQGVQFSYDERKLLNNLAPRVKLGDIIVDLQERVAELEARVAALEAAS
jgi:hypothetical protein